MLGPYGNAWIQTPTFSQLACESALFDRYYTSSLSLSEELGTFWRMLESAGKTLPAQNLLLSDDDFLFQLPEAKIFGRHHCFDWRDTSSPVTTLEETRLYRSAATILRQLEGMQDAKNAPFFLWAHLSALRNSNPGVAVWDFPMEYRELYRDEEDPEPYGGVTIPNMSLPNMADTRNSVDPDDLQAIMEAYSGGVTVLDTVLGGLLDAMQELGILDETLLIVLGTRGFSLGEHGIIGASDLLLSESIHQPLFIRFPQSQTGSFRTSVLLQSPDLATFLARFLTDGMWNGKITAKRDHVTLTTTNQRVLIAPDWLLRQTSSEETEITELYAKPDDRWEVNNVANRCPEIVEGLLAEVPTTVILVKPG